MKVIPPVTITPAMLTSSSIAEPDPLVGEVSWVSGATYPIAGTRVILPGTHRVYEKLNTNVVTNLTVPPNLNTSDWFDYGPTNRWAMFDTLRTTGSLSNTEVRLAITPSAASQTRINSIALIGCTATHVTISITSNGVEMYNYSTSLITRSTVGWYSYFYGSFDYRASVVNFNLPPILNSVINIIFTIPASSGVIGNIIIGNYINMGDIQTSPRLEALNFSKIDRDAYGNSLLVPRRSIPRTIQKVFTSKSNVNRLMDARDQLNAIPAVWAGIDDNTDLLFEPLLILGVYKEFSISMDYPDHALVSLQLEEM